MRPYVLKNRGSDHSLVWMGVFFLAVVATVLGGSWSICVFLEMVPAAFSERITIADAFDVNPWLFGVVFIAVCYALFKGREVSIFSALRKLDAHGIMCYLGAERVAHDRDNLHLRRIININEEIAIAAGRAPAQLYLLWGEVGINAFTAGVTRSEACLCVTEGALRYLARDELQAVVAHEYGHIASGDVRTNTMMVRWLGLLMPMGFTPRKSQYFQGLLILAGMGLLSLIGGLVFRDLLMYAVLSFVFVIIGLVAWLPSIICRFAWRTGAGMARRSHAAHSREREMEADALSAQFTRNPESLAGALRKIGGLRRGTALDNDKASMFSHMCIAPALFSDNDSAYAMHPGIAERVEQLGFPLTAEERRRLHSHGPEALAGYAADVDRELGIMRAAPATEASPARESEGSPAPRPIDVAALLAPPNLARASKLLEAIPPGLRQSLREPAGARAVTRVLLGLPLAKVPEVDTLMMDFKKILNAYGPRYRLPLLELATPALQRMDDSDCDALIAELRAAIEADSRITLHEFVFFALISNSVRVMPAPESKLPLSDAYATVLGTTAHEFSEDPTEAHTGFDAGARHIGLTLKMPLRKSLSIASLESALARLRNLDDQDRPRVITALTAIVARDGVINCNEVEFVRAIGAAVDCSIPLPAG
jgi:Zn-dependent protease with chaperone function